MLRRLWLAVPVVAIVTALAVVVLAGWPSSREASRPAPEDLVLRLSDLPPGYTLGDDSFCGPMPSGEGMPADLQALLLREEPDACYRQFEMPAARAQGVVQLVESTAIVFTSERGASAAFASIDSLLRYLGTTVVVDAPSQARLGDESRALLVHELNSPELGVVVAWRSGRVLSYVRVGNVSGREPLEYASELAALQEGRVRNPSPAPPDATDDTQAALDRPGLGVPVYWLGAEFAGSTGLPALRLARSGASASGAGGPGNVVEMEYEDITTPAPRGAKVVLTIWSPESWRGFLQTALGELATSPPCGEPVVTQLSDRRIEVHPPGPDRGASLPPLATVRPASTPAVPEPIAVPGASAACPLGYVGHVYFADAVVAINLPFCLTCPPPPGAYDSAAGIEAVARALRTR